MEEKIKLPPLGLKPRYFIDIRRAEEIIAAIYRYLEDGETEIPLHWIKEYNEIIRRIRNCNGNFLSENYGG